MNARFDTGDSPYARPARQAESYNPFSFDEVHAENGARETGLTLLALLGITSADRSGLNPAIDAVSRMLYDSGRAPSEHLQLPQLTLFESGSVVSIQIPADRLTPTQRSPWSTMEGDRRQMREIPLAPATQEAKDALLATLRLRFRDDPETLRRIEESLRQLDRRILSQRVIGADGSPIDQQQELASTYAGLSQMLDGQAERLVYTDSRGGREQNVFSAADVNRIFVDAIRRLSDLACGWQQGPRGTCALQSVGRQEAAISSSTWVQRLADVMRTGEFTASDLDGGTFTCRVDRASLRLDAEALMAGTGAHRGAAGQIQDLALGQLTLDLRSGEPGRFVYTQDHTPAEGTSGEHVFDTRGGRRIEVAQGVFPPDGVDALTLGRLKQSAFGNRFGRNFGRDTTLVHGDLFNSTYTTSITSSQQMAQQMTLLNNNGWSYATVALNVGHWPNQDSVFWHAVSINGAGPGLVNVINNWGPGHDHAGVSHQTLLTWMGNPPVSPQRPEQLPGIGPQRPDSLPPQHQRPRSLSDRLRM